MQLSRGQIALALVVGAVAGSIGDSFHVHSGTEAYPPGVRVPILDVPWWVPLEMGVAVLATAVAVWTIGRARSRARVSPWRPVVGIGLMLGLWALSGWLAWSMWARFFVLMPLALAMWWWLDRDGRGLIAAGIVAASGTVTEIVLVQCNVFHYLAPSDNFLGVPCWLPWLYVAATVAVSNLVRASKRRAAQ
jgi:hypothetical protein